MDSRTGVFSRDFLDLSQLLDELTVFEIDFVVYAVSSNSDIKSCRQGIDHGNTNTVQSARVQVVFGRKLGT